MRLIVVLVMMLATGAWAGPKEHEALETPVITEHTATIGGVAVTYTVAAGMMPILDEAGKTKARIFYVAYLRKPDGYKPDAGVTGLAGALREADRARPMTFTFNGGPGSSSVWLHLGTLGPRRIALGPEGQPPAPPYRVSNNAESWLDFTDMVFIDPVSTGFSRAADGEDPKQFHGLDEDVRAVGTFIRMFTSRYQRWGSPKFLVGESYGTTRAAALAGYLQDEPSINMYLNGIVLVSPVLNFGTIRFDLGNDVPYWVYLPTYTATAWYHGRLEGEYRADLRKALRASEEFAQTEYMVALAKGDMLGVNERKAVATKLAKLTGLGEEFLIGADLRPTIGAFTKELLRDRGRTVGRLDSRYSGIDRNDVGATPDYDPSMAAILGPYSGAMNAYVREDLKVETDTAYEILTGKVNPWNYAGNNNRYVNVAETLRGAMTRNANLKVLVASGYYDLATPYFAADYTVRTMGLDPTLRGNISHTYYEGGHMMYVRDDDLARLKKDAKAFYGSALTPRELHLGAPGPGAR